MIQYHDVRQAAKILIRHEESVRRACRQGHLNYDRVGRAYRFTDDQLKAYTSKYGSTAPARAIAEKSKRVKR